MKLNFFIHPSEKQKHFFLFLKLKIRKKVRQAKNKKLFCL